MTIIKEYKNTIGKIIFEETGFKEAEEAYKVYSQSDHMYTSKYFSEISDAVRFYEKLIIQIRIIEVVSKYTTEMEGYSYYGSNMGVPEDNYEYIAQDIRVMMEKK